MRNNSYILDTILNNWKKHQNKVIVYSENMSFSWADLHELSIKFEQKIGRHPRKFVYFYADNCFESIVFIFTAYKLGKCFIPVNRGFPFERIAVQLSALAETQIFDPKTSYFDNFENIEFKKHFELNGESLYLLFTSGSTGVPKGVQISEKNLSNTLNWSKSEFQWTRDDVIGLATSLTFDISLFDVFTSLTNNVPLCILPQSKNIHEVAQSIINNKVTSIFSTPALFTSLINFIKTDLIQNSSLRQIISGGDFFPLPELKRWLLELTHIDIYNVWGPTETAIVNTSYKLTNSDISRIDNGKPISIGRASNEMDIRILRQDGLIEMPDVKKSELGEILVLGESVGLGYINPDEPSKNKFQLIDGKRAFATGDIGFFEDNLLYMIGRDKFMLKLQGYRIDPRDIEFQVLKFDGVAKSCALLAGSDTGVSRLVLLVESKNSSGKKNLEFAIRNLLKMKLPNFMVPKEVHLVEKIPLNENGKIDRKGCEELLPIIRKNENLND